MKRPSTSVNGKAESVAKKRKTDTSTSIEEIHSARQIQGLLAFSQDDVSQQKHGIASFKVFLEGILYAQDDHDRGAHITILREYLEASRSRTASNNEPSILPDLTAAWGFGIQTGDDSLVTAVSSLFALLLKTLSTILEFRELGLVICRTLLQYDQTKHLSRGLSAEAYKDHLISPCLRILTEIVSFDGGTVAARVFDRQDAVFNPKFMDRNLRLYRTTGEEDRRKLSVRTNAVRYLLAHLRFQPLEYKIRILENRHVLRTLFDHLPNDTLETATEIVRGIEASVLKHQEIPRRLKSLLLSDRALTHILDACRIAAEVQTSTDGTHEPRIATLWTFLTNVCTNDDFGVLLHNAWYPRAKQQAQEDTDVNYDFLDLDLDIGLTEIDETPRLDAESLRNPILSKFLQNIRPYASVREKELLLSTFSEAPELVADYIQQSKQKLSMEPKLTNTWMGLASLFFSIIDLPVPAFFRNGESYDHLPPPVSTIVENILPSPLDQKVLTRCLNQSSDLISLYAVRLLSISLRKLSTVLAMFDDAAQSYSGYRAAGNRLRSIMYQRLPAFADVVILSKKPAGNVLREACLRLIRLYYTVVPQLTSGDSFDVAGKLTTLLEQETSKTDNEKSSGSEKNENLHGLELQHLVSIAQQSQGLRWWNKQGSLAFSSFTTLLKLCIDQGSTSSLKTELRNLLASVSVEHGVLRPDAFPALIGSLQASSSVPTEVYTFFDECVGRLVRKPIKYLDDLDELQSSIGTKGSDLSLLVMVCLEQGPFTSRLEKGQQKNVLTWLATFFAALKQSGENSSIIDEVRSRLLNSGLVLPEVSTPSIEVHVDGTNEHDSAFGTVAKQTNDAKKLDTKPSIDLTPAPEESQSRSELRAWQKLDTDELVEDGTLAKLIFCLCSQYAEVRTQALTALNLILNKIEQSTLESKEQIWLLLSELLETTKRVPEGRPLPYIVGSFAAHALKVLADATHLTYPKVNRYLLKDPVWNIRKLPEYWLTKTTLEMPTEDEAYWDEVLWVLDFLVDGVRTNEDVNVLRARGSFERILGLFDSPGATRTVRERVVQVLYRTICAGGATVLVTSCALVAWLQMQKAMGGIDRGTVDVLVEKMLDNINVERVTEWSNGLVVGELESLVSRKT